MTTIEREAELFRLSQQHAAHLAQAQQHQQAAANLEREIVGKMALLAEAEKPKAENAG